MRWLPLILCLASCTGSKEFDGAAVLRDLAELPVGIVVTHTPNIVEAPLEEPGMKWKFRWPFKTEVSAIDRPLTIRQFGIAAWNGKRWILPSNQEKYNCGVSDQASFIKWYNCPNARIEPGRPAADPENWAGNQVRQPFKQKWFFIGVDSDGQRFKGEAIVELRIEG